MSNEKDDGFKLLSSFVLSTEGFEIDNSEELVKALPTLNLHLSRFEEAHKAIARAIPDSWCANESPINPALVLDCLKFEMESRKQCSKQCPLRYRMTVGPSQSISLTSSPLPSASNVELLVKINDCETTYKAQPFLLTKTTIRTYYDDTRSRNEATYLPQKGEIFDVVMYNHLRQITETTIANVAVRKKSNSSSKITNDDNVWITPHVDCGLLNGVRRQLLLSQAKIVEGIIQLDDMINQGLENWETICFNEVRGVYHVKLIQSS